VKLRERFAGLGWRAPTTLVLSLLGLADAGFLTWGHYFDQGAITNSCKSTFGGVSHGIINCGLVTTGSWSNVFGIPVAVLGAVFFVFMVAVNLPWGWRTPSIWVARSRLAATVAGVCFVVFLVAIEALVKHAICIYCTGVHLLTFALFLIVSTGWQDTGWAKFVDSYDAGLEQERAAELDEPEEDELTPSPAAVNRRAPRAPRSERKKATAGR
jgi:uncharacterized membrane protein